MPTKKTTKKKPNPKAKAKPAKGITFRSNKALFDWMQDEYLSEITLDDVKPAPKKAGGAPGGRVVDFTWSLHGTGNGDIVPFHVRAAGVRTWSIDGAMGKQAIGMSAGKERGIHFFMDTPARIELACDIVEVQRGEVKKGKRAARPFTDYDHFFVEAERRITFAHVLDGLGAPDGATLVSTSKDASPKGDAAIGSTAMIDAFDIVVRGTPWVSVRNFNHAKKDAFNLRIARANATDDEWHRAQELPHRIGPTQVSAAYEVWGDDVNWMNVIGKPVAPRKSAEPPKQKGALDQYASFAIEGTKPFTLKDILAALSHPADAKVDAPLFDDAGLPKQGRAFINISVGEWPWANVWTGAAQRPGNQWRLSIKRDACTDDEWRRVMQQAPRMLHATWVHCGSKLMGSVEKWLKAIANA